ncbi:MAG: penicillin-binding protein activator [Thaumarchaeota archaeon]|nr:penicillin-binding protein activator [Nitrososphaerota archaeon]
MSQPKQTWLGKGIALLVIGLIIGAAIGVVGVPAIGGAQSSQLSGKINIGALLSLTGDLRSFGENERAGLELARDDINAWLSSVRPGTSIELVMDDTATLPEQALQKLQAMNARGIKFIIGPLSSGEVRNLKPYADQNNILIASQSSTAVDLAVGGDNVFRFIPDDRAQGPALARLMWDAGIRFYIPIWRGDTYGDGLKASTETAFKNLGGTVDSGIRYNIEAKEFGTEVATLASKVQSAISSRNAREVAIHLVAFEEAVVLINEADKRDVLKQVKWFGSDGTAGSGALQNDAVGAAFSQPTKFLHTIFAPTSSELFSRVRQHVMSQVGREPDTYTYTIHDILWVYTLSILAVGKYDPTAVKQVLPIVSGKFFGASGWTTLNDAGDRLGGDYDVWALERSGNAYEWKIVGTYIASSDKVSWKPGFEQYA